MDKPKRYGVIIRVVENGFIVSTGTKETLGYSSYRDLDFVAKETDLHEIVSRALRLSEEQYSSEIVKWEKHMEEVYTKSKDIKKDAKA